MPYDLIIFDCDGVLIDTERHCWTADSRELSAVGIPITPQEVAERFTGMSFKDMYRILEEEHGVTLPPNFHDRIDAAIRIACQAAGPDLAVQGVAAALDAIALPRCVASSSTPDWLNEYLTQAGLWDRFAPHVFSAVEVKNGKPAPDLFLHAAARMGADPRRCLVVEDSVAGTLGATEAGMTVLGFTAMAHDPTNHGPKLTRAGARHVFDRMDELPTLVAGLLGE